MARKIPWPPLPFLPDHSRCRYETPLDILSSEKLDDEVIDFLADSIARTRAVRQWFDLAPDDEAFLRSLGIKVKNED